MIKEILETELEKMTEEEVEIKFVEIGCGGEIYGGGMCGID